MNRLPTLLVLANASADIRQEAQPFGSPDPKEQALRLFNTLHHTLRQGLESGLPMLLVAPQNIAEQARTLLPGNCVVELPDIEKAPTINKTIRQPDNFSRSVVAGVLASANANGWLILPACMPMLRSDTLRCIARAPAHEPIVVPQYQQFSGHPIRFSSEFFSELIRLQSERDLSRLIASYPTLSMEVNDPGVIISSEPLTSFSHRAYRNCTDDLGKSLKPR